MVKVRRPVDTVLMMRRLNDDGRAQRLRRDYEEWYEAACDRCPDRTHCRGFEPHEEVYCMGWMVTDALVLRAEAHRRRREARKVREGRHETE